MQNKRLLLQELKGERVTIYTLEKEFTGVMRKFGTEFSICRTTSNTMDIVTIKPADIVDFKRISMTPVIFVHNHFDF